MLLFWSAEEVISGADCNNAADLSCQMFGVIAFHFSTRPTGVHVL